MSKPRNTFTATIVGAGLALAALLSVPGVATAQDSKLVAGMLTCKGETKSREVAHDVKFNKSTREMATNPERPARSRYEIFDFVNVDTEGNVLGILEQIDAAGLGVELMCVEWNGRQLNASTPISSASESERSWRTART